MSVLLCREQFKFVFLKRKSFRLKSSKMQTYEEGSWHGVGHLIVDDVCCGEAVLTGSDWYSTRAPHCPQLRVYTNLGKSNIVPARSSVVSEWWEGRSMITTEKTDVTSLKNTEAFFAPPLRKKERKKKITSTCPHHQFRWTPPKRFGDLSKHTRVSVVHQAEINISSTRRIWFATKL